MILAVFQKQYTTSLSIGLYILKLSHRWMKMNLDDIGNNRQTNNIPKDRLSFIISNVLA